jgi:hypothetical protein
MLDKAASPDIDTAIAFLIALRPHGPWNLTALVPDGGIYSNTFTDEKKARAWLTKHAGSANLHYTANPATKPTGKGGRVRKEDLQAIEHLHADLDVDKLPADHELAPLSITERKQSVTEQLQLVDEPTFIVNSGGGVQATWRLKEPLAPTPENIAWAEGANRALAMEFPGGEPQCANVDHLLRLPGTVNHPDARKRQRGRTVVASSLMAQADVSYDRSVFKSIARPASERADITFGRPEEVDDLDVLAEEYGISAKLTDIILYGRDPENPQRLQSRSEWVFSVVNQLLRHRVPPEMIMGVLLNGDWSISDSVLEQDDKPGGRTAEDYAAQQVRRAIEKQDAERRADLQDLANDPANPGDVQAYEAQTAASDRPAKPAQKRRIRFTPFAWQDPKAIPPREFLYKPNYIRRFTTGTLAHGAIGKSILLMTEAVAIASGMPLLGTEPRGTFRVVYWNGEDPQDELDRRFAAIRKHYEVPADATGDRLFVDSGRTLPINVVTLDPKTRMAIPQDVDAIVAALIADHIDILTIDPSVASHSVPENQNEMAEKVAQAWNDVAERANVAVHLAHHAVKARGREVEAMDFRGGGASLAKLRHLRVLNRMTGDEAKKASIEPDNAWRYIRADDGGKPNLVPPSGALWYQMVSVDLENAALARDGFEHAESDVLGVPAPWRFPEKIIVRVRLISDQLRELFQLMAGKVWKKSWTSDEWVGRLIAEVADYDLQSEANRKGIERFVKELEEQGILCLAKPDKADQHGNKREGYVAGEIPDTWLP